jgi:GGDEF domain-containing protein
MAIDVMEKVATRVIQANRAKQASPDIALAEIEQLLQLLTTLHESLQDPGQKKQAKLALDSARKLKTQIAQTAAKVVRYEKFVQTMARKVMGVDTGTISLKTLQKSIDITLGFAHEDELTGLANRRFFMHQLNHRLTMMHHSLAENQDNIDGFSLVYLDIDGMKQVNDILSHSEGDNVLRDFAAIARMFFRVKDISLRHYITDSQPASTRLKHDLIGRIGGDEFLMIIDSIELPVLERKLREMSEWFEMSTRALITRQLGLNAGNQISPAIPHVGISYGCEHINIMMLPTTTTTIITAVEQKMYANKRARKTRSGMDPDER